MITNSILKKLSRFLVIRRCASSRSTDSLVVYNSLTKTKELLKIQNGNNLMWYSCGPTTYDSAHIGHASSYVSLDIIKRILKNHFGINVTNLMNITDVDDKIINKALQENKSIQEVSGHYEKEFFSDLAQLNCERPSIVLHVTTHIPQIIEFIQGLIAKEHAYVTKSGSVYFRTERFKIKSFFTTPVSGFSDLKENMEKENDIDFALWKACKTESEPGWKAPWGTGRPGWHIECSTLANIAFGKQLDFHSGGKDLVFPHHHNEMTQCCAYHDCEQWGQFWLHTGHLHYRGDVKMSKSLKNTVSIQELLKKYSSDQFRLFCLLSPYRYDIEFSDEKMQKPVNLLRSFHSFFKLIKTYCNEEVAMPALNIDEAFVFKKLNECQENVHLALADDFNTCLALDHLIEMMNLINKQFQNVSNLREDKKQVENNMNKHYGCVMSVSNYIETILTLFGIQTDQSSNLKITEKESDDNDIISSSLKFRERIREIALDKKIDLPKDVKENILKACDQMRIDFKKQNIELKDFKTGTIWQKI